jgi:hypothetical protein
LQSRSDLSLSNLQVQGFLSNRTYPTAVGLVPNPRGWLSVDAAINGRKFRFATTHLETRTLFNSRRPMTSSTALEKRRCLSCLSAISTLPPIPQPIRPSRFIRNLSMRASCSRSGVDLLSSRQSSQSSIPANPPPRLGPVPRGNPGPRYPSRRRQVERPHPAIETMAIRPCRRRGDSKDHLQHNCTPVERE